MLFPSKELQRLQLKFSLQKFADLQSFRNLLGSLKIWQILADWLPFKITWVDKCCCHPEDCKDNGTSRIGFLLALDLGQEPDPSSHCFSQTLT